MSVPGSSCSTLSPYEHTALSMNTSKVSRSCLCKGTQISSPAGNLSDGCVFFLRQVKTKLNLHGVVSIEGVTQIVEEEYEEPVKVSKQPGAADAPMQACAAFPTALGRCLPRGAMSCSRSR